MRLLAAAAAGIVLAAAPSAVPNAGPRAASTRPSSTYTAPVGPVRIVRPFMPPATKYGAGHRGVDLATTPGALVRAAGDGVVRFAGRVAGRGLVVVVHPDGVSTEYEPLQVSVRAGAAVLRGAALGRVSGGHGGCAPGRCLHWGARRGSDYLDPMVLLRPLGRVRLLPWP